MKNINAIERIYENYGLKLTLTEKDEVYSLTEGKNLVVEGDFDTVKNYVHGIEYGLTKKNTSSADVVDYFSKKINGHISATVSKRAKDTYYSQENRHFKIKILGVKDNVITYQADSYNTVPSGVVMGGTKYSSPIMTFEIPVNVSMTELKEKVLDKMLMQLDEEIKNALLAKRKSGAIEYINTDMIINITEEDVKRFSYTNFNLVTISYLSEYSL